MNVWTRDINKSFQRIYDVNAIEKNHIQTMSTYKQNNFENYSKHPKFTNKLKFVKVSCPSMAVSYVTYSKFLKNTVHF